MSKLVRTLNALAATSALTLSFAAHADDQDVVDYRRHVMKTMDEEIAALMMVIQHKAPTEDFSTQIEALAITASTAKKAFEPKVPGGDAKPEIWGQWPDFARRLDALVQATGELAQTAKSGGLASAGPKVQTALTCKSCHDIYRVERPKTN